MVDMRKKPVRIDFARASEKLISPLFLCSSSPCVELDPTRMPVLKDQPLLHEFKLKQRLFDLKPPYSYCSSPSIARQP